MQRTRYGVIGAGNGGRAMAGHLALMGYDVSLYNRTESHISAIRELQGIEVRSEDGISGFGEIRCVTSDIHEAAHTSDVLMVAVPSTAHVDVATTLAPVLRDDHIVVLNPGRTLGAIEFARVLRDQECGADVTVAEAATFLYASRSEDDAAVRIFGVKKEVPLAALPARRTQDVLRVLNEAYPQFIDGGNVLQTGLDNMGSIFHPALTIMNASRIEQPGRYFQFYMDGVTPSVAKFLEVLDRERCTVASMLGVTAKPALAWLNDTYHAYGENLYEAVQNNESYRGIPGPTTLNHRYIFEDVPMSIVPIATLGERFGVRTRGLVSVARTASIMHETDYFMRGRTPDKLGIGGLSVTELNKYVNEGELPSW